MAFSIVGNTISTGGEDFPALNSHSEAVKATQEAVRRAEHAAKVRGLPKSAVAGLAADELGRLLLLSPLSFGAILRVKSHVPEGDVIELLDPLYQDLVERLVREPELVHQISPWRWEQLVAASYDRAGFDEVILTPRSGDLGRDVIAIKRGFGSVRILDQVKAYSPGHRVKAKEVRELVGVLLSDQNATKAMLTTTSEFAPGIWKEETIQQFVPFRLELFDKDRLLERLASTLLCK